MLKGIVLACAAFGAFLPLHVAIFHLLAPVRRFDAMVRLHAGLALALVAAHAATPPDLWLLPPRFTGAGWLVDAGNGLLVQAILFVGYSMFYFLVDRGFSARILIEIEQAPGGRLTAAGVARAYPPEQVVGRRLGEMLDIGSVARAGDRYRITPRGRWQARLFGFLKAFFHLGPGG